ncbi:hypothetical protein AVEN_20018-1 [Araneus ventricosus]|uniref:Nose resistant-to-fluoxetine protein N-terminal domain-containing protein n=1 Tax=Araneus ventricosus TaxID=182803 RepID=A0A4Y2J9C8_ARAVE|nr:hypothetical protein AVEN_20018-1 [Araneus ventricosus]
MSFIYHQFLVLVICFLHIPLFISCEIIDQPKGYNIGHLLSESSKYVSASKVLKSATESDKLFLNNFSRFLQGSLQPVLLDHASRSNSSKCFKDLRHVFESAKSEEWAMRMLDSYAKPESGFMLGNVRWVGEFTECLGVYAPPKADTDVGDFHGKYCSLEFHLEMKNMSVPLYVGLCLPESCNPSGTLSAEVENLKLSGPIPTYGEKIDSLLNTTRLTCQPRSTELTTSTTVVICVIGVFVLLALAGTSVTVYEHFTQARIRNDLPCFSINPDNSPILGEEYKGSYGSISEDDGNHCISKPRWLEKFKSFLNCFCILTNGKKLLSTSNTEGQMLCVHGIRFLSISWVILCHTYGLAFLGTSKLKHFII